MFSQHLPGNSHVVKSGKVTLFFIAQIDDCAKMLKETNLDFNVANH